MVSGEKRKTLGNVFASALRALQPAVGMRACHRIFSCRSSCLRAVSVCEPLLCVGIVLAIWRASGAAGVWMAVVTSLSGKSSRASGSEQRCPIDKHLLDADVDVGEDQTVETLGETNFPSFLTASSGTASRRGTNFFESFTSRCRREECG